MSDQMEEQLAARLGEGQIAQLVQDDQIQPGQVFGHPSLAPGSGFGFEPIDQIDHAIKSSPRAGPNTIAGNGDSQMGLVPTVKRRVAVAASWLGGSPQEQRSARRRYAGLR